MRTHMGVWFLFSCVLLACSTSGPLAQNVDFVEKTLSVIGRCTLDTVPDQLTIDFQINSSEKTASKAYLEDAEKVQQPNDVLLDTLGIASSQVITRGFTVEQIMDREKGRIPIQKDVTSSTTRSDEYMLDAVSAIAPQRFVIEANANVIYDFE